MTRAILRAGAAAMALLAGSAPNASAQAKAPRFEISAGGLFVGGYSAGERDADITANQTGGSPYTIFKSDSRVASAPGIEARVGFRLSSMFTVEGGVFTARPRLTARLSADIEGAPEIEATEDLSVYIIDAALMTTFGSAQSPVTPFIRVGAGYVRELHEDNALVETGQAFHAGGGVTMWFNRQQSIGARADARIYFTSGGIDLDGGSRTQAAGGGAVVFAF